MSNLANASDFNASVKPSSENFEFSNDLKPSASLLDNLEKPFSSAAESDLDNFSANQSLSPNIPAPPENAQSIGDQALFSSAQPLNLSIQPQSSINNPIDTNISSASSIQPEAATSTNSADIQQQFSQEEINAAIDSAAEALFTFHLDRESAISLLTEQGYAEALAIYVIDSVSELGNESDAAENAETAEYQLPPELDVETAVRIAAKAIVDDLRDRETTVAMLVDQGYPKAFANQIVDRIYAQLLAPQPTEEPTVESGFTGTGRIILGIILLLTGILLTAFSVGNAIWYGAIVVGLIEIFRGIAAGSDR